MVMTTCAYYPNIEGYRQVNPQNSLGRATDNSKLLAQQESLFQGSKVQSDRGRHQTSSSGHCRVCITAQSTCCTPYMAHTTTLRSPSSFPWSTVKIPASAQSRPCLSCSLLSFSGLNITGLNEGPWEAWFTLYWSSRGQEKKEEGLFEDTIVHGFEAQVNPAPKSQT